MAKFKAAVVVALATIELACTNVWDVIKSEKGYSSLFKAGIVLLSASMIAISQSGAIVYASDISAAKARFETEVLLKKKLKVESQCFALPDDKIASCRGAVYEARQVSSAWKLTLTIFRKCYFAGVVLLAISGVGFTTKMFEARRMEDKD